MSNQTPLTSQQKSFKYQIWLMLVIVFGVISIGFVMIPKTEQDRQKLIERLGTTNMGQLVTPSPDLSPLLTPLATDSKPKWQIVIVGGDTCDLACNEILHNTRQIHILLGKYTGRVKRLFLPSNTYVKELDLDALSQKHPFLQVSAIDTSELKSLFKGTSAEWDMGDTRYLVVTPDHKAVLYYTAEDDASGLLDDLKHLLKYSPAR
jgi:hypothetical protein